MTAELATEALEPPEDFEVALIHAEHDVERLVSLTAPADFADRMADLAERLLEKAYRARRMEAA